MFVVVLVLIALAPPTRAQTETSHVVFVHGMGQSADDIGKTQFGPLMRRLDDVSVFRFVDDMADGGDSQSGVQENADKLAREIAALDGETVLIGYSMGGAIIRTYLATHRRDAERDVAAVIFVDAVASGSWGYAFANELPRRIDGSLGEKVKELMRSAAASSASVDFSRPATRDLSPRSAHFRKIAPMPLPSNISYYTFWGHIQVVIERGLLLYDLPDYELPSLGDLGLLPGSKDPATLPELGGQRFSPPVDGDAVALDIPHEAKVRLNATVVRDLIDACGKPPEDADDGRCGALAKEHFTIPNTHTAVPNTMDRITVDTPELGGETTLLDAILTAIARHR